MCFVLDPEPLAESSLDPGAPGAGKSAGGRGGLHGVSSRATNTSTSCSALSAPLRGPGRAGALLPAWTGSECTCPGRVPVGVLRGQAALPSTCTAGPPCPTGGGQCRRPSRRWHPGSAWRGAASGSPCPRGSVARRARARAQWRASPGRLAGGRRCGPGTASGSPPPPPLAAGGGWWGAGRGQAAARQRPAALRGSARG